MWMLEGVDFSHSVEEETEAQRSSVICLFYKLCAQNRSVCLSDFQLQALFGTLDCYYMKKMITV